MATAKELKALLDKTPSGNSGASLKALLGQPEQVPGEGVTVNLNAPVPEEGLSSIPEPPNRPMNAFARAGIQSVVNNLFAVPELVAQGAQDVSRAVQGRMPVNIPAIAKGEPRNLLGLPDATDVQAAGRSVATGEPFAESLEQEQATDIRLRESNPVASTAGDVAGDVATLLAGRKGLKLNPFRKPQNVTEFAPGLPVPRGAKALPTGLRAELKQVAKKIAKKTDLPRGLARAAETGAEGATLALLDRGDPAEMAAFGAGGQMAGSLALTLLKHPIKGLAPAVATATIGIHLLQAVGPGDRNIFEALDAAGNKVIGAVALGTASGLAGLGRGRFQSLPELSKITDALISVPRTSVLSLMEDMTKDDSVQDVIRVYANNPDAFSREATKRLERAIKNGNVAKEVNKLLEVPSFRKRLDEFSQSQDQLPESS